MTITRPFIIIACLSVAACVPQPPEPTPPPIMRPAPTPTPDPEPIVSPTSHWADNPATPGDWTYSATSGGSQALFGSAPSGTRLILQCNRAASLVLIVRPADSTAPVPMRILTETQDRLLTATPDQGGTPALVAGLPARDPLLDAMAISKGRFAIETAGLPTLYVPSWPEVTRVVEDCR